MVRYSKSHADETRASLVRSAAEVFREKGHEGAGINALAEGAEVTSGALYRQFGSKQGLFHEVVADGFERLVRGIEGARATGQSDWRETLIMNYLSSKHVKSASQGCLLPTLSVDVARHDKATKRLFSDGLRSAVAVMNPPDIDGRTDRGEAALLLAALLGSVILSRATGDNALRQELERALLAKFSEPNDKAKS